MMVRTAVLINIFALPAMAQTVDDVAAMTVAIEEVGCVVTAENGDAVLAASGLSEEDTMAVIAQMYAEGVVALQADGTMSLISEVCS